MGSAIKQRLRRYNGTDYDSVYLSANVGDVVGTLSTANGGTGNSSVDTTPTNGSTKMVTSGGIYTALQNIDGANVNVEVQGEFTNPLNTDQLTAGQHDVYFTAYPSIKWHVDHLDGNYAYLGLYTITETTMFGSNNTYSGSTIAAKCATFLNNTIPNVADYLESVTVENVTNKVFIPTYYQMSGKTGYGDTSGPVFTYIANASSDTRKTIISNDWTQNPPNYGVWLSTASHSGCVWSVRFNGGFNGYGPSNTYGFRPEVKVRYKTDPVIKDLNTALNNINSRITSGTSELTPGTSALATGTVYLQYE